MEAPCRYKVFDDYNCIINTTNPKPAFLNGDTAIRPYLLETQKFQHPIGRMDDEEGDSEPDDDEVDPFTISPRRGFIQTRFNITEDMSIDLDGNHGTPGYITPVVPTADDEALKLLCQPLPLDLTTCYKDLLILMAAYNGDIDRYYRLRRPQLLEEEIACVVRGICMANPCLNNFYSSSKTLHRPQHLFCAVVEKPALARGGRLAHSHGHFSTRNH